MILSVQSTSKSPAARLRGRRLRAREYSVRTELAHTMSKLHSQAYGRGRQRLVGPRVWHFFEEVKTAEQPVQWQVGRVAYQHAGGKKNYRKVFFLTEVENNPLKIPFRG